MTPNAAPHDTEGLTSHALGALAEPEARALEAHLATCPDCAREWKGIRETTDALRETVPPETRHTGTADPDDLIIEGVLSSVRAEKGRQTNGGGAGCSPPPRSSSP